MFFARIAFPLLLLLAVPGGTAAAQASDCGEDLPADQAELTDSINTDSFNADSTSTDSFSGGAGSVSATDDPIWDEDLESAEPEPAPSGRNRQLRLEFGDQVLLADTGRTFLNSDGDTEWLLDNVTLLFAPYAVSAQSLQFNAQTGRLVGTGIELHSDSTLSGSAKQLSTRLPARGEPWEEPLLLSTFRMSFCDEGRGPGWAFKGRSMQLNQQDALATIKGMSLNLMGIPFPGPPVARIPLDGRSISGFLVPAISFRNHSDVDIALPYLISLGRSADWTVALRNVEGVGEGLESHLRYLGRDNSGNLSTATLDTASGRLSARSWRHHSQPLPALQFVVNYSRSDRRLLTRYAPATVRIPGRGSSDWQLVRANYRLAPLVDLSVVSERYEGPDGRIFGDYRREVETQVRLQQRSSLWYWSLTTQSSEFGYDGRALFFTQASGDRPLSDASAVDQTWVGGRAAFHPQAAWGWGRVLLETNQIRQSAIGHAAGQQASQSVLVEGGLRLVNASGALSLEPMAHYRQLGFSAAGSALHNTDGSLYPASAVGRAGQGVAGAALLESRDSVGLRLNLRYQLVGQLQLGGAVSLNRWGAAHADSLLLSLAPELNRAEQTAAVSFSLSRGGHSLQLGGSSGERLYDKSSHLAYSWSSSVLNVRLGRFGRDRGGGRNGEVDSQYMTASLRLGSWYVGSAVNLDQIRNREISSSMTLRYSGCCFSFAIGASDYFYTNHSRVTRADWLAWESLPVAASDRMSFSFRLKTGL